MLWDGNVAPGECGRAFQIELSTRCFVSEFPSSHHKMLRWAPEGIHLPSIAGTSRPFYGGIHLPQLPRRSSVCACCICPIFIWLSGLPFEPSTRTQDPIVTGAGIVACKFDNGRNVCYLFLYAPTQALPGVLIAADTLGSYGSLARFKDVNRVGAYGSHTIVGAAGDLSDFQVCEHHIFIYSMFYLSRCRPSKINSTKLSLMN